jgi:hypothetical protein
VSFFVSFADAARVPRGEMARAVVIPERGVFFVVEGDGLGVVANAIDHAVRTSTRADDIAEVLDGLHQELAGRGTPASLAMAIREDDAVGFFGAGTSLALLCRAGVARTVIAPRETHMLGALEESGKLTDGENAIRFFRAYVRAGTLIVLATQGAHINRDRDDVGNAGVWRGERASAAKSVQKHAEYLVDGPNSLAPAAAIVIRVDEEPKIR